MRLNAQETMAEASRISRLAWPVMLTSLNWTLMHLIDVAVVGHAGSGELGELAAGRTLTYVAIVMGLAAMSGVLVFVARADGGGRPEETGDQLRRGILLALGIGLPCMAVLLIWAEALLLGIGVPGDLAAGGSMVVRAMALGFPTQLVQIVCSFFLEGVSRPRRVMIVNLAQLPLNAVLAWALVSGQLGLPALGSAGAAAATSFVSLIGALLMYRAAWTLPDAGVRGVNDVSAASWMRALRGVPALFRFGYVPAIAAGLELAGFSYLIVLSTQLGAVPAAAFQTVFSLHNLSFALAMGFGSAAGVRAGNAVGAGDPVAAVPRTVIAAVLATVVMLGLGLIYVAGAGLVMRPFSDDPAVRDLGAAMLVALAPFMFLDGVQVVLMNALRSLGDQVAAAGIGVIAFFLVTGGLGSLLVRGGFGAMGLVYASAAGMAVAASLQAARMWWISSRLRPQSSG